SSKPLAHDAEIVLSALAYVGQSDAPKVAAAFAKGAHYVRTEAQWNLRPRERCGLRDNNRPVGRLGIAYPQIKKNVLDACVHVVGADGVIQEHEAELLRAIAEALDCPMPPFVTT